MLLASVFVISTWWRLRDVAVTAVPPASDAPVSEPMVPLHTNASGESPRRRGEAGTRQERYRQLLQQGVQVNEAQSTQTRAEDAAPTPAIIAASSSPHGVVSATGSAPRALHLPQPPESASRKQRSSAEIPPAESRDPDSDLSAPQLLSATFSPQQIADGEETTLTVGVVDDLSGVRVVSGLIVGPSGALQGFSAQRDGESDSYTARIRVPKDAADGIWRVRHLTLTDKAGNSATLTDSQGALPSTASFRVVSATSDSEGPTLKAIWLDRTAMRGGERNSLFVQAEDDKSGVAAVSGVFVGPARTARISFGCQAGANSTWTCPVAPPVCLDCGSWRLEQVQLQDKANNITTVRSSDQIVGSVMLDIIADLCDSSPPMLSALLLDPLVVSNAEGGVIRIQATAHDDGCGVGSMSGFAGPAGPAGAAGGQRIPFSLQPSTDGRTFTGRIAVPRHAATGRWQIGWIQALDKGFNLRTFTTSEPVVAAATFQVE
ncbi:MAG TPA: hypothetical protein VF701_12685 [Thermoanaerobaculia bacterium]